MVETQGMAGVATGSVVQGIQCSSGRPARRRRAISTATASARRSASGVRRATPGLSTTLLCRAAGGLAAALGPPPRPAPQPMAIGFQTDEIRRAIAIGGANGDGLQPLGP